MRKKYEVALQVLRDPNSHSYWIRSGDLGHERGLEKASWYLHRVAWEVNLSCPEESTCLKNIAAIRRSPACRWDSSAQNWRGWDSSTQAEPPAAQHAPPASPAPPAPPAPHAAASAVSANSGISCSACGKQLALDENCGINQLWNKKLKSDARRCKDCVNESRPPVSATSTAQSSQDEWLPDTCKKCRAALTSDNLSATQRRNYKSGQRRCKSCIRAEYGPSST